MISVKSVAMTNTKSTYKNHFVNWSSPLIAANTAAPSPCVATTLKPPIKEQMLRYTSILFLPYLGATNHATATQPTMMTPAYDRKPGVIT